MTPVPEIATSTLVRASRERVYDALTQAAELDAWFTTGAEIDPRPGGEMILAPGRVGPERTTAEDRGPVLEARRSNRYVPGTRNPLH
ncbi:MAG TPA: SRPBCC domain-containing protein [Gaiellaceae bacterium]|nr:SRPBCC domain-containing protein [Gaiellaceae bacterium]